MLSLSNFGLLILEHNGLNTLRKSATKLDIYSASLCSKCNRIWDNPNLIAILHVNLSIHVPCPQVSTLLLRRWFGQLSCLSNTENDKLTFMKIMNCTLRKPYLLFYNSQAQWARRHAAPSIASRDKGEAHM
jgi:hypothetical protein